MPQNGLGTYVRQRRLNLGLSQEQLAGRMGGTVAQAEISRLERGHISLPRRGRLEDLAGALEVSLGALLMHSGWLTKREQELVDAVPTASPSEDQLVSASVLGELDALRQTLLAAIERIGSLETTIQNMNVSGERPTVTNHTGIFDDWEKQRILVA